MAATKAAAAKSNAAKEAAAKVENFAADTQKAVTESVEKMTKGVEDAAVFGQQNLDAVVKSSEIFMKAAETIGNEFAAYSKKSFDEGVAAAKDMAAAKNVSELFEMNSAFAQAAFEGFVAQATKVNELVSAAAKDASAPINERVNAATDLVKNYSI